MKTAITALSFGAALVAAVPVSADTLDLTTPGLVTPSFRGSGNTTYFGWDVIDESTTGGIIAGFVLDDDTPDINASTTGARLWEDPGQTWGHRSSSNNYYTGPTPGNTANDSILVPTAGVVGPAGYTTIVVQLLGNVGGDALADITFGEVNGVAPTAYYGVQNGGLADGVGNLLFVWELTGNAASYTLHFSSTETSRALDAIVVDTIYSTEPGAFTDTVVVPEPAALALCALPLLALGRRARKH